MLDVENSFRLTSLTVTLVAALLLIKVCSGVDPNVLWHASCNPKSCDHTHLDTGHIQERVPNWSETSAMLLSIDDVV